MLSTNNGKRQRDEHNNKRQIYYRIHYYDKQFHGTKTTRICVFVEMLQRKMKITITSGICIKWICYLLFFSYLSLPV